MRVNTAQKFCCCHYFFFICSASTAENQQVGIGNLVIEKLTEVSHIHFAFSGIYHRNFRSDFDPVNRSDRFRYIRQLSHARRLNQYTVRCKFCHNFLQSFAEIPHERAADATGVHFCDFYACVLQKCTVNGYISEFIFNKNQLFPFVGLGNQLADQCCLPSAKKTGKNICFCHDINLLLL